MRDISHKNNTLRIARAKAELKASSALIERVKKNNVPKGNVLEAAKIAAIQAAKNTSQIIPFCHPLPIDFVGVDFELNDETIKIFVQVKAVYKTGVEMEALTAASVAALTMYDMLKPFDQIMQIDSISLLSKEGGKSDFIARPDKLNCAVIVMSDSIASGKKEDKAGKLIVEQLKEHGLTLFEYKIIPDDPDTIYNTIVQLCDQNKVDLVITIGGTGLSPRDNTPEVISRLIEREIPGIAEAMRNYGQNRTPFAMLSRSKAGMRNKSLIISLPGSTNGAKESMDSIFPAVLHIFKIANGSHH